MDDSKKAPAILLFKNMKPAISRLTDEDRLSLFDAILQYADEDTVPEMNYVVSITFEFIKRSIDTNEEKYKERIMYQKARYEERKKQEEEKKSAPNKAEDEKKDEGKSTKQNGQSKPSGEAQHGNLTEAQASFLNSFKELCPNQNINCKISDFPDVDLNALILAIKKSPQYLMNPDRNKNLNGLRWYLENATNIINGRYKKFNDSAKPNFTSHHSYTAEEMNSLFQNIDEIEL